MQERDSSVVTDILVVAMLEYPLRALTGQELSIDGRFKMPDTRQ